MIEINDVTVRFKEKHKEIVAVENVSLTVEKKDIYGIIGYSGAGKSTLIRVINSLQRPTTGEVYVLGKNILNLTNRELRMQRKKIGMIFQHFNLMNERTVFSNVEMPLKYSGISKHKRIQKVEELLELVDLKEKKNTYPRYLSGGQKQRVAIARALANKPEILLCDEATSALDPKTTFQILDLLKDLNHKLDLTIVIITHDMEVVKNICNKVAVMENGQIIEKNDVVSIFSNPKKLLTKEFIQTSSHVEQSLEPILLKLKNRHLEKDESLMELSFAVKDFDNKFISELYEKHKIKTSILYSNVNVIKDFSVGNMIVLFYGDITDEVDTFFAEQNITTKYLK